MNSSAPFIFPAGYVDPPPEPKVAYPEPPLRSADLLALIHGSTFFAGTEEGALVPPEASVFFSGFDENVGYITKYAMI